jgi:hypothetical protein
MKEINLKREIAKKLPHTLFLKSDLKHRAKYNPKGQHICRYCKALADNNAPDEICYANPNYVPHISEMC